MTQMMVHPDSQKNPSREHRFPHNTSNYLGLFTVSEAGKPGAGFDIPTGLTGTVVLSMAGVSDLTRPMYLHEDMVDPQGESQQFFWNAGGPPAIREELSSTVSHNYAHIALRERFPWAVTHQFPRQIRNAQPLFIGLGYEPSMRSLVFDERGGLQMIMHVPGRQETSAAEQVDEHPSSHADTTRIASSKGEQSRPQLHWINQWLMFTSIIAALGIAVIYWGSSLSNPTVIFAGLLIFSGSAISWLVPFTFISFWFFRTLRNAIKVNWPSIRCRFARR